ncbi:hypothetical protein JGS22_006505 [Streptomyces sp. P38-E01]|uniref:Uncharacterized protein n=1 Tax=Streptomyces tardus TaxID=2780544 RepID=A0A949JJC2_9ACTN|nr:hypothetical protein [Streptomyces tardus]MBU7597294.1 hypothetical protein [Streptomyces tardus]
MTKLNGWKVLNEGQGGEVVLGVDFATTGRSDSSFSDLAPNLGHGLALWETRQPDGASAGSAEDFLGLWADGIAASGRTVRAVLGYCAGSVHAGELAARIAERQGSAPVFVMFDPEVPTHASLYRDFVAMMNQFAAVLSADEVAAAHREGEEAQARFAEFAAYGDELVRIFQEKAGVAFAREELDTEMLDEFVAVFRSFVAYLNAARQIDPAAAWSTATAVNSEHPTEGAAQAAVTVDIAVAHSDILRDKRVADAVNDAIKAPVGS